MVHIKGIRKLKILALKSVLVLGTFLAKSGSVTEMPQKNTNEVIAAARDDRVVQAVLHQGRSEIHDECHDVQAELPL